MKLLQFTDIHLTTPGAAIGGRDPNANFDAALAHATALHDDAEALVITGDLSDWGDEGDYRRLRARLATIEVPAQLCIGNHDDRAVFRRVFPEFADASGFVQHSFALSQGIGVCLDTWGPQTHAGHFCAARAAWLDAQLAGADGPAWLFMHHNPIPTHVAPMDEIMLRDAHVLGEVVRAHRARIAHIFFGHCHMPLSGSFHGVPVSAPRGTNHAGFAHFPARNSLSRAELPQAYAVVLTEGPAVTVHMVEYGAAATLTEEGSPDYAAWDRATMTR